MHVDIGNLCSFIMYSHAQTTALQLRLSFLMLFIFVVVFLYIVVVLAQCALFAEISTEQEERQTTLKYS